MCFIYSKVFIFLSMQSTHVKLYRRLLIIFLACAVFLSGCISKTTTSAPFMNTTAKGALTGIVAGATMSTISGIPAPFAIAVGGVAGTIIGYDISKREQSYEILNKRLDNRYVNVFYLGQQITVVVSSDRLFYEGTARLHRSEYPTLSLIAEYIRQFRTEGLHVGAYTSKSKDPKRDVALTEQQAQSVVQFLWREGVNARMITGLGYGSTLPIANEDSINGQVANRRIEIQFQWIPKDA